MFLPLGVQGNHFPARAWGNAPKRKNLHPQKGTKARGTTQIPAVTGTLMRNVHETDFPTIGSESRLRWELLQFLSPSVLPAYGTLSLRQFHYILYIFTVVQYS